MTEEEFFCKGCISWDTEKLRCKNRRSPHYLVRNAQGRIRRCPVREFHGAEMVVIRELVAEPREVKVTAVPSSGEVGLAEATVEEPQINGVKELDRPEDEPVELDDPIDTPDHTEKKEIKGIVFDPEGIIDKVEDAVEDTIDDIAQDVKDVLLGGEHAQTEETKAEECPSEVGEPKIRELKAPIREPVSELIIEFKDYEEELDKEGEGREGLKKIEEEAEKVEEPITEISSAETPLLNQIEEEKYQELITAPQDLEPTKEKPLVKEITDEEASNDELVIFKRSNRQTSRETIPGGAENTGIPGVENGDKLSADSVSLRAFIEPLLCDLEPFGVVSDPLDDADPLDDSAGHFNSTNDESKINGTSFTLKAPIDANLPPGVSSFKPIVVVNADATDAELDLWLLNFISQEMDDERLSRFYNGIRKLIRDKAARDRLKQSKELVASNASAVGKTDFVCLNMDEQVKKMTEDQLRRFIRRAGLEELSNGDSPDDLRKRVCARIKNCRECGFYEEPK